MAWNDWKAALKDGLSSFKWNPKPAAEAAEAYMRSELKRTGQLPTGEPPPKQAMWNPISEERQRALAETTKAREINQAVNGQRTQQPSARKAAARTPFNSERWSATRTEPSANRSQQRIVAPDQQPKAEPLSMSAFSRGMLEETGKMDRGRGQQELSLPSAARGRGRGPSL